MSVTTSEALARTLLLTKDLLSDTKMSDEIILNALTRTTVCIVGDLANASTASGQAAVTTLAALVTMMGMRVRLVLPEVDIARSQPPLGQGDLRTAVQQLVSDSVPGVTATIDSNSAPNDLVFVLGSSACLGPPNTSWRLVGAGWTGTIAAMSSEGTPWVGDVPFGGLAAASLAAMEAYKAALRTIRPSEYVLPTEAATVSLGPEIPIPQRLDLGRLDIVSGGAITSAMLHTLLRVPGLAAGVRIFEPERLDPSNLNRYPLALRSMLGWDKIAVLSHFGTSAVRIRGERRRFTSAVVDEEDVAPILAVGADHIPTRWMAQTAQPDWLGIGSTSHFYSRVSDHLPGEPCSACLHPEDDPSTAPIPTISFVSYWAGLLLASKLVRWALGQRAPVDQRVTETHGLRFDSDFSFHHHPLRPSLRCPLRCTASSNLGPLGTLSTSGTTGSSS